MSAPRSLVLITVDCLRADHVGFMGYPRQVTPFLDSLAADSLVFESAIAGGAPTYYSFPAIMASRHPLGKRPHRNRSEDRSGKVPAKEASEKH